MGRARQLQRGLDRLGDAGLADRAGDRAPERVAALAGDDPHPLQGHQGVVDLDVWSLDDLVGERSGGPLLEGVPGVDEAFALTAQGDEQVAWLQRAGVDADTGAGELGALQQAAGGGANLSRGP